MESQFTTRLDYSMLTLYLLSLGIPFHCVHYLHLAFHRIVNLIIDLNSPKSNDKEDLLQLAIQKSVGKSYPSTKRR